jgi:hypothetical protein
VLKVCIWIIIPLHVKVVWITVKFVLMGMNVLLVMIHMNGVLLNLNAL